MKDPELKIMSDSNNYATIKVLYHSEINDVNIYISSDEIFLDDPDKVRLLAAKLNEMATEMEKNK